MFSLGGKIHFLKVAKHIFSKCQNIFSLGGKMCFLWVAKIYFPLVSPKNLLMVAKGVLLSVPPDGGRVSADRETGQSDNLLRVAISLCRTYRVSFLKVLSASYN